MRVELHPWEDYNELGLRKPEPEMRSTLPQPNAMTYHKESEHFASQAEMAARNGMSTTWLYRQAAWAEITALNYVPIDKPRTYSILAVSAVALAWKSDDTAMAYKVGDSYMRSGRLLPWAVVQIGEILRGCELKILTPTPPPQYKQEGFDLE